MEDCLPADCVCGREYNSNSNGENDSTNTPDKDNSNNADSSNQNNSNQSDTTLNKLKNFINEIGLTTNELIIIASGVFSVLIILVAIFIALKNRRGA